MNMMAKIGVAVLGTVGIATLALADTCSYQGVKYSEGSTTCQAGTQFKCDDGSWESLGVACPGKEPSAKNCEYKGTTFSPGAASCQAGTQYKCTDGSWASLGVACAPPAGDAPVLAPRTCMMDGSTVSSGSTICKTGVMFACENGEWRNIGTPCR